MGEQLVSSVVTVATAIVGLALIAILVSKNADTANVIGVSGSAFSNSLLAAEAPVIGGGMLNSAGTYHSAGYM
jgi:membrane DNA delivery protein